MNSLMPMTEEQIIEELFCKLPSNLNYLPYLEWLRKGKSDLCTGILWIDDQMNRYVLLYNGYDKIAIISPVNNYHLVELVATTKIDVIEKQIEIYDDSESVFIQWFVEGVAKMRRRLNLSYHPIDMMGSPAFFDEVVDKLTQVYKLVLNKQSAKD